MRDLVWPLPPVWLEHCKGTTQHTKVSKALGLQVDIHTIIHEHAADTLLPPDVAKVFTHRVNALLKTYSLMANQTDRDWV